MGCAAVGVVEGEGAAVGGAGAVAEAGVVGVGFERRPAQARLWVLLPLHYCEHGVRRWQRQRRDKTRRDVRPETVEECGGMPHNRLPSHSGLETRPRKSIAGS